MIFGKNILKVIPEELNVYKKSRKFVGFDSRGVVHIAGFYYYLKL